MSTPKPVRRERGYYSWRALQPRRPVGKDEARIDRWFCRRACREECKGGRRYRQLARLHRSLPKKWR